MTIENQVTFAEVGNPKRVTQLTENTDATGAYFLTEKVGETAAKKTSYATVESAVKSKVQSEYLQTLTATPASDRTMSEKLAIEELKKRDDKIVKLEQDTASVALTGVKDANYRCILDAIVYDDDIYTDIGIGIMWKNLSGKYLIRLIGKNKNTGIVNYNIHTWEKTDYTNQLDQIDLSYCQVLVDWSLLPDGTTITSSALFSKNCYDNGKSLSVFNINRSTYIPSEMNKAVIDCHAEVAYTDRYNYMIEFLWKKLNGTTNLIRFAKIDEKGVYTGNLSAITPTSTTGVQSYSQGEFRITINWDALDDGFAWNGRAYFKKHIKQTECYELRDTRAKLITVRKDGKGDFTTIDAAYKSIKDSSIDNQYEICVYSGIYNELNLIPPAYSHTYGLAPNSVIVTSAGRSGTLPVFDQQHASSKLSNMTIESHTGYCIHYDIGLDNCTIVNTNLNIRKIYKEGAMMTSIGGGGFSAAKYVWKGCTFYADRFCTASCHTNAVYNQSTHLVFESCVFFNTSIALGNTGGYGNYICEVIKCSFPAGERSIDCWHSDLMVFDDPLLYRLKNQQWQVIGGGNKNLTPMLWDSGKTIKITGNNKIYISGSAVELLFGYNFYIENEGKIIISEYHIDDVQRAGKDIFQMWKRLGDCSSSNKTLTVSNGAIEKTFTFSDNYLSTKESMTSIIAKINVAIGEIAAMAAYEDGAYNYETVNTVEKIKLPKGTATIGKLVDINGNIVLSTTPKYLIAGWCVSVNVDDIDVWNGGYRLLNQLTDGGYNVDESGNFITSQEPLFVVKNKLFAYLV